MKHPQRKSTQNVYIGCLLIFWRWCQKNKTSRRNPTQASLAEFFQYLFYTKALSYSTGLLDLSSRLFTNLIKSYFRDKPVSSRSLPSWNLSVVLDSLQRYPFEPLPVATIKYLTLKTMFLISLATGRRRSEIRAISFKRITSSVVDNNQIYSLPLRISGYAIWFVNSTKNFHKYSGRILENCNDTRVQLKPVFGRLD